MYVKSCAGSELRHPVQLEAVFAEFLGQAVAGPGVLEQVLPEEELGAERGVLQRREGDPGNVAAPVCAAAAEIGVRELIVYGVALEPLKHVARFPPLGQ